MAPTSDERREVAERLRENAEKRGVTLDYLGSAQVNSWWLLLHSIECNSNHQEVAFNLLADLIDPTCEVMEVPDNDEFMVRVVSGFVCKRCGHEAIVERNCDGSAEPPKYCPHCGRRLVWSNEG